MRPKCSNCRVRPLLPLLVLFLGAGLCHAAPTQDREPVLRLLQLPADAQVYVDQQPAKPVESALRVTPDVWHEIQVEAEVAHRILAARRWVLLRAGQERSAIVALSPVVAPGRAIALPGPRGPVAPPGPRPLALPAVPVNPAIANLRGLLAAAMDTALAEFADTLQATRQAVTPPLYWCDPDGVVQVRGRGARGPVGRSGPRPEPPASEALLDLSGQRVSIRCQEAIGLTALWSALRSATPSEAETPEQRVRGWRITLHTPELRRRIEADQNRAFAAGTEFTGTPGPPGLPGPRLCTLGRELLFPERRIPEGQVRQLMAEFAADPQLKRRIDDLRPEVDNWNLRREEMSRPH